MIDLITGNKFKKICHYSLDEFGFSVLSEPKNNEIIKFFVKIDFIHDFFRQRIFHSKPYELYTHNGDIPVSDDLLKYMDEPNLIIWYGQNINTVHKKIKSIPIGIANEKWPHGNEEIFYKVMKLNLKKDRDIYVNFDINTNLKEREYCLYNLKKNGLILQNKLPFEKYLMELSKSYFVVSPNGNGIDCHKTWESLYMKTIPIVTKSINSEYYSSKLPICIIDSWSDFNPKNYNEKTYYEIWKNFDQSKLTISNCLKYDFSY